MNFLLVLFCQIFHSKNLYNECITFGNLKIKKGWSFKNNYEKYRKITRWISKTFEMKPTKLYMKKSNTQEQTKKKISIQTS